MFACLYWRGGGIVVIVKQKKIMFCAFAINNNNSVPRLGKWEMEMRFVLSMFA